MTEASETTIAAPRALVQDATLVACAIGLVSVFWFVLISGWIGVVPGSVLVERQNVLFNSDTNAWIDEMVRGREPIAKAVHPFETFFWRQPSRALQHAFHMFTPTERADLLAARFLVATVAGAGVGCLALVAVRAGSSLTECALLFSMYLLFSSSVTIALPEHFGLSSGLLSMSFAAPIVITNVRAKAAALAALTALCGGTTVTNALYPLVALWHHGLRFSRARRWIGVAAILAGSVIVVVFVDSQRQVLYGDALLPSRVPGLGNVYSKTARIHSHVLDYANLRLIVSPKDALAYSIYAVVAPAIGPTPVVRLSKGRQMVTYEAGQPLHWSRFGVVGYNGFHLRDYSGIPAVAAVLWSALLLVCGYHALRDRDSRKWVWLPLGWIGFNVVLHNLWGDELFLYAPHWSWALMAVVILGARQVSRTAIAALVVPLMLCQAHALVQFKAALSLIGQ